MKIAFVICSRSNSSRVPGKVFRKINGVPLIEHLLGRIVETKIPIILAVPDEQFHEYSYLVDKCGTNLIVHGGIGDDPLQRMYDVAKKYNLDHIIRLTHDKIFIDPALIYLGISDYMQRNLDYLYSSKFTEGTGFEIISTKALEEAVKQYKKVEYVSYAIRAITKNSMDLDIPKSYMSDARLLVDYPEDLVMLETIFSFLPNNTPVKSVIEFLNTNPWVKDINRLPDLTIYTCAYNAESFIERAMASVERQRGFKKIEYILVDDHSTDKTAFLMSKFSSKNKNVTWIKNDENLGLASSSNVALKSARGKYIIRLDADDYFVSDTALQDMLTEITNRKLDVVYPNNYFGTYKKIQNGKECHHVGGSIFSTRAINHIKFTEGLRGFEGLDLFERAKLQLRIGYLNKPIFFYTQRDDSLSKTNIEAREKIKEQILTGAL